MSAPARPPEPAPERLPMRRPAGVPALRWSLALLVLLAVTLLCYRPGLSGPLLLDDEPQLVPLFHAVDAGNWRQMAPAFVISPTGPGGRPIAMLSLLASVISHGSDLPALKRENLALHLLCGLLLIAWVLSLQRALPRHPPDAHWRALLAGGLWLLHPMLLSTVLYSVQRMTLLSTLFMLAGLLAYSEGRQAQRRGRVRAGGLCLGVALLCWPLAFFSKENGILLLPLCAALEWTLFSALGASGVQWPVPALPGRQDRILRLAFGLLLLAPLVAACTVLAPHLLRVLARGHALRAYTLGQHVLTEPRVWMYYLQASLWPSPASLAFYHDEFPLSHSLLQPWTTLPAMLALLALLLAAIALRRRAPLCALGLWVFLIGHSLEGSVVPLELVFEHRNYLPLCGLVLCLVSIPWAQCWPPRWMACLQRPGWVAALCVLPLLCLALLTAQRAGDWSSAQALFPRLYALNPGSPRLSTLFANAYANAGQFDMARAALANQDSLGASLQLLDIDCLARAPIERVRLDSELNLLQGPIGTYETQELIHLANDVLEQRCGLPLQWGLELLDRSLRQAVTQPSSRQMLWLYHAHLQHLGRALAQAQADLQRAEDADPANPLPLLLSAEWALASGDRTLAGRQYDQALRQAGGVWRHHPELYASLARRLQRRLPPGGAPAQ